VSATPRLTIVVPAHQAAPTLGRCLESIRANDLPRAAWELVVVDDASTDETSVIAACHADAVVRLAGSPHGPAYARNRGFDVARAPIVLFVDADVCLRPDAPRRVLEAFDAHPEASAVSGAYEARAGAHGIVTAVRNLLEHHQQVGGAGETDRLGGAIAGVRADAFRAAGGFDEWLFVRPEVEDLDFGRRLRRLGHVLRRHPEIRGLHVRRWTLRDVLFHDFSRRALLWQRILRRERAFGFDDARGAARAVLGGGLAVAFWAAALAALLLRDARLAAVAATSALGVVSLNLSFHRLAWREAGILGAAAALPLHLASLAVQALAVPTSALLQVLLGDPEPPVTVTANAALQLETWPPRPVRPNGTPPLPETAGPAAPDGAAAAGHTAAPAGGRKGRRAAAG
jgi:glycosyltransferase involved in cell wall biosynthesis